MDELDPEVPGKYFEVSLWQVVRDRMVQNELVFPDKGSSKSYE